MDACPECDGLLIEDMDDENFSASEVPIGYYCPGCGWSSDDEVSHHDNEDYDFVRCSRCDGHDACEDFGCAFELGLGYLVNADPS